VPTFDQQERLKSRKIIGSLFKEGQAYVAYPLRVVWVPTPPPEGAPAPDYPAQVAVSVSKRLFKTAVARNRIKRQIREAYRLHKHELYAKLGDPPRRISLMLSYIAKEPLPFADIEAGVKKMVRKMPAPTLP
jgi:ribonuclease P protein component